MAFFLFFVGGIPFFATFEVVGEAEDVVVGPEEAGFGHQRHHCLWKSKRRPCRLNLVSDGWQIEVVLHRL